MKSPCRPDSSFALAMIAGVAPSQRKKLLDLRVQVRTLVSQVSLLAAVMAGALFTPACADCCDCYCWWSSLAARPVGTLADSVLQALVHHGDHGLAPSYDRS